MLIEYIERLRREPPEVRKRAVLYWTVGTVCVVIVLYFVYHATIGYWFVKEPPNTDAIASPYEAVPVE